MPVRIVDVNEGSSTSFRFEAMCSTDQSSEMSCGIIKVVKAKGKIAGLTTYYVRDVNVNEEWRRRGVATALYTAAAKEACRRRGHLASLGENRNPRAHSHDFWAKQARKGRAITTRTRSERDAPTYIIKDCPAPTLDGARRQNQR